ncbi:MAG: ribosome biogenesis GTPase Der [Patescibacteria group bacterium]
MENKSLKTVAIIGRPNVGKSTLFNRLIGKRVAIETAIPGTTRDRLYGEIFWCGQRFALIDVAGIEFGPKEEITRQMRENVDLAMASADLVLFLVDWTDKTNDIDKTIARKLREMAKAVILVVNKADNKERQDEIEEFRRLGNFDVVPVSAISGSNTGDLLDLICDKLQSGPKAQGRRLKAKEEIINLAILGRPNVGKSTLLNRIIGAKRAIVSPEPGTTRDVFSVRFKHKGNILVISDTAGIRRPGKIKKDTIESFSVLRSWQAAKGADIVVLVTDAEEGLVAADAHLLGQAIDWGKGIVLAINKIDLWPQSQETRIAQELGRLQDKLNFAPWLPVVFISAESDQNIKPLLDQVVKVYNNRQETASEDNLAKILAFAKERNPQLAGLKSLRQVKSAPPVFLLRYSRTEPHYTQIRYLENKIRDVYPFVGTPIFIDLEHQTRKR